MEPLIPHLMALSGESDLLGTQGLDKSSGKSVNAKNKKGKLSFNISGIPHLFAEILMQNSVARSKATNKAAKPDIGHFAAGVSVCESGLKEGLSSAGIIRKPIQEKQIETSAESKKENGISKRITSRKQASESVKVKECSAKGDGAKPPLGSHMGKNEVGGIHVKGEKQNRLHLREAADAPELQDEMMHSGRYVRTSTETGGGAVIRSAEKVDELRTVFKKFISGELGNVSPEEGKIDRVDTEVPDMKERADAHGKRAENASSGLKRREILSPKIELQAQEGSKENSLSRLQVESEKSQNHRIQYVEALKSEGSVEKTTGEIPPSRIDTHHWNAHSDVSGLKNVGNGAGTNVHGEPVSRPNPQVILSQVADAASGMLKRGFGRIVLTLDPPNLGTLSLDVSVRNEAVRMLMITEDHDVKQILQSNVDQLKTSLHGQGLNMDRFDVLVQDKSYENHQGAHQWGGAQFEGGRQRRNDVKEEYHPIKTLTSGGQEPADAVRPGVISLFA